MDIDDYRDGPQRRTQSNNPREWKFVQFNGFLLRLCSFFLQVFLGWKFLLLRNFCSFCAMLWYCASFDTFMRLKDSWETFCVSERYPPTLDYYYFMFNSPTIVKQSKLYLLLLFCCCRKKHRERKGRKKNLKPPLRPENNTQQYFMCTMRDFSNSYRSISSGHFMWKKSIIYYVYVWNRFVIEFEFLTFSTIGRSRCENDMFPKCLRLS